MSQDWAALTTRGGNKPQFGRGGRGPRSKKPIMPRNKKDQE